MLKYNIRSKSFSKEFSKIKFYNRRLNKATIFIQRYVFRDYLISINREIILTSLRMDIVMGRDKQQSVRKSNRVLIGSLIIKAADLFCRHLLHSGCSDLCMAPQYSKLKIVNKMPNKLLKAAWCFTAM